MNGWNIRPVIVLTPVHPSFARQIGRLGRTLRHRQLVAYLRSRHPKLSFDLLDASNIHTFGGTRRAFYHGVHMKVANVHRRLDRIARWQNETSCPPAEARSATFEKRTARLSSRSGAVHARSASLV